MNRFQSSSVSRTTGVARNERPETLEFSFTISAAADDHWCRCVASLAYMLQHRLTRQQSHFTRWMSDHPGRAHRPAGGDYELGLKSPISDDGVLGLDDFEDWLSRFDSDLPESHFAPFAKGYPRFSKSEMMDLISICNKDLHGQPDERWMTRLLEDTVSQE